MGLNPKFDAVLAQMAAIHDKKSADYASSDNRYSNFEMASDCAGITISQGFRYIIGIKLARLNELEDVGKDPNNESLEDSRLDLATYAALYASYFKEVAPTYFKLQDTSINCICHLKLVDAIDKITPIPVDVKDICPLHHIPYVKKENE